MDCLYEACIMQLSSLLQPVFLLLLQNITCNLHLLLLDTKFFIDKNPINKINVKIKLYSLVLKYSIFNN